MFGGVDLNDLTLRCLKAIEKMGKISFSINIVLGLGYRDKKTLLAYSKKLIKKGYNINNAFHGISRFVQYE